METPNNALSEINRQAATTLELIINQVPSHIYWLDKNGYLIGCNLLQAHSLNYDSVEDVIGKHVNELVPKEEAEFLIDTLKNVIESGEKITIEEKITFKGKVYDMLSHKLPLLDKKGVIIGLIGVSIDITDKKNAEKFELEKNLAEQKAAYSKVAAGSIAHDLRTPLASINAGMMGIAYFLEPLLKTYDIAKEAGLEIPLINKNKLSALSKVIDNCNNEIAFSHDFINQTLNNLQHDSIDTSGYKRYNIKTVLESALESYPYQGNERELLHTDLAVDFDFWGSDVYLKNMLNNLLKNSFYYIAAARRGEIYITTLENEDNFIIKFKDTAQGAPVEVVEHMFDGYFSKRSGGTGLGLAFCKTVMESFDGFITAKSIEGEFIEFTLLFPKPPNH